MKDSDTHVQDGKHASHKSGRKNTLGISPAIYGLGVSFKDALVWGAAMTVAMIGVLGFGHKKPGIAKTAKFIDETHIKIKEGFKKAGDWVAKKIGIKNGSEEAGPLFKITPATVAASVAAGWFASHLAQVPGLRIGYKQAKTAINAHNAVVAQNDQLTQTNADLLKENNDYRLEIAKRDASFTEQLAKQAEREATSTAQSR